MQDSLVAGETGHSFFLFLPSYILCILWTASCEVILSRDFHGMYVLVYKIFFIESSFHIVNFDQYNFSSSCCLLGIMQKLDLLWVNF